MTNDQFNKLSSQITGLAGRLDKADDHLAKLEDRFAKLEDLTMKLYQHMEARFDKLGTDKADRSQVDRLQTTLDGIAKDLEIERQERAAITSQLDRHEEWIGRADHELRIGYDRVP